MASETPGDSHLGEAALREIVRHSSQAVAILDRELRYLLHSERWLTDYELGDRDILGLSHYEVFPDTAEHWRRMHQRCMAEDSHRSGEDSFIRADGGTQWISWDCRPWRLPSGEIGGLVLRTDIITPRKETEQELAQFTARLAEAQRLARLGYWEWQLEDNVVTWSDEVYGLFGVDLATRPLSFEDYFSAVRAEEQDSVARYVNDAIAAAAPFYFEHGIIRPDGSPRHVAIHGRIQTDAAGKAVTLVGAAQDVTERHELEEQLRRAQKMEATGRLAGGVAHDFNNMLTAMFGFAEFALESLEGQPAARADIEEIIRAAGQAKTLTQQLLAFSRQQTITPRVVNINERVATIHAMVRRLLGEDIAYSTHLADDLWNARVDPSALEQVMVNLAVNARDAMPNGGRLTLETANVVLGEEETGARGRRIPAGQYVAFIISDDGAGMTDEVRERIFDPFYTTKGVGIGTGLGLSTCYGIIRQANGFMWVYSELGRGTTFKIYLPRVLDAVEPGPVEPETKALGGEEVVLIAEDNAQVRDVAMRILRELGYNVVAASSGEEALRSVSRGSLQVDLLLTDVVMPGMTGKELADRLSSVCPQVTVLFMSGYTQNSIVHHGVLDPGIELLQKPFDPRKLGERVRQVLNGGLAWRARSSD